MACALQDDVDIVALTQRTDKDVEIVLSELA
eukprot:CAMPEP_0171109268 /NCGR_PEP_ID=MMETSP0766_2-20121228/70660_1 /TAXON_ID=439317 /ORGANISM="Gambierdiscus australes, Strain CAWD 149" /LENGTH=30 /DNA_ID= /DNA_START= /DNA_END= /DNA_ORIENTATION=